MPAVLLALTVLPLLGVVLSLLPGRWIAPAVSVTIGVACLGLTLTLVPAAAHGPVVLGFLRADAISVVFELGTAFLYATAAVYSVGYLRGEHERADFSR
ncbi:MAG: proton-conducting transporter membrane subunit, partial [Pseudonocardiaceae bacterium]